MTKSKRSITLLNKIIQDTENEIEKMCSKWSIFDKQDFFHSAISIYDSLFIKFTKAYQGKERPFEYILLKYSYSVFIKKFYDSKFEKLPGVVLRAIDDEHMIIYSRITYACGIIGWIQNFINNINAGEFSSYSLFNFIRIRFNNKYHWNEHIEQEYVTWYGKLVADFQREEYEVLDEKMPQILSKLKNGVFIWREQFLGYTNDMETEEFFWKHAFLDLQQTISWDLFPPECKFGDLYYCDIANTVVDFAGYAIKHIYCADILRNKNPNLLFENLLKYAFDLFVQLIVENRNVSKQQAEKILSLITLDSSSEDYYCNARARFAPFIKISGHQYIRSLSGLLSDPMEFILYNLRKNYKSDWDKNVNLRERIFREQLYTSFGNKEFKCINRSIIIGERDQRITDIDAAIIDQRNGEIALFQLKWQDSIESSSFSLKSKSSNFFEQTNLWIEM